MLKQEPFEQLIKSSLTARSEEINPPQDLGAKVRNEILGQKRKRSLLDEWSFKWKKFAAAAACLTFIGGGISLAFSPGLQAWAGEKADSLLNKVNVVMNTREIDGGVITSTEIEFQDSAAEQSSRDTVERNQIKAGGIAGYGPYATLEEAEREAGFRIKAPAYYPEGYGLHNIWVGEYIKEQDGQREATGQYSVSVRLDDGINDGWQRLDYIISESGMEFKPGFKYEEIKVGDMDARWFESEITLNENGQEPQQVIERAISWQDGGMTYLLNDATGLSRQELVKMVESIQ